MRKLIKNIIKGLFSLIVLVVILALVIVLVPSLKKEKDTLGHYENVISENVSMLRPVTEVAMLGAHDAFSHGINYSSGSNIHEGGIATNELVNTLGKGIMIKMSKAQVASAKQMLYKGVRYFDVRVTKIDGEYYTCHSLLSYKLETYVKDIVEFLDSHPKEFIVFDIQHFYTENGCNSDLPDKDFEDLFNYLDTLGLMDHINYLTTLLGPSSITYGSATNLGTKGGVVMLAKTNINSKVFYRDGDASYSEDVPTTIRSYWHNRNSNIEMLEGMEKERKFIEDRRDKLASKFRVNQAQMTGFITKPDAILRTLLHWDLLGLADAFNKELVSDKTRFNEWLDQMPIFMVDDATSDIGGFNALANEYISNYNKSINISF